MSGYVNSKYPQPEYTWEFRRSPRGWPGCGVGDRSLNLLCLDGGGIKGLSALYVLEKIVEMKNGSRSDGDPWEYFDMIGGTSTGGLIAIMLGRLEMSVEQCIEAYTEMAGELFGRKKHRLGFNLRLHEQEKYDSEILKRAIQKVLKQRGFDEDELMRDRGSDCATFVCATAAEAVGGTTVCFRSYPPRSDTRHLYTTTKIWEAARATSAATTFFDPIEIGRHGERFIDGGLGANNPINEMWREATDFFCPEGRLEEKIACLVSIGTGVDSLQNHKGTLSSAAKTLVAISTETERTHQAFQNQHPELRTSGRYFRFNVPQLSDIGMDEAKSQRNVAAKTRNYVTDPAVFEKIEQCANAITNVSFA